jgi:chromosome partitioning protein
MNRQMAHFDYMLSLHELGQLFDIDESQLRVRLKTIRLPGNQWGVPPAEVRQWLQQNKVAYPAQILALINLKGGVGKTTSAVSLATRAAQYGFKTCVLDLDSQASATLAFGIEPQDDEPIFIDLWQNPEAMLPEALWQLQDGLYLLPSSLENGLLDVSLANPSQQKNAVRGVCRVLHEHGFELIVLDCPPSLGAAVISAACAASTLLIPVGFDAFSQKGLHLTVQEVRAICDTFGLDEPLFRVLFTQYDRRVKQAETVLARLREDYGAQLIPTPIHTTTQFAKASASGKTIFAAGGRSSAKADYDACWRYLWPLVMKQVGESS